MKLTIRFSLLLVLASLSSAYAQTSPPASEYNPGPDPKTPHGRALIDLYADMPEYQAMASALMGAQKFRYIYGMMLTRSYFRPNAVKILFIGQDATHIAEAAKQPGTSGFGARVQSIGNFFGVDQGVSTTNAFLSTIKGQYGAFNVPYVETDENGGTKIKESSRVDNDLWLLANGAQSEIRKKREAFWEWMLKNNSESMGMIVPFGGAARDAFAEFLISRGAQVETRIKPDHLAKIKAPEMKLVFAGGNNEFPVPVDKKGKDIYDQLIREKYKDQPAKLKQFMKAGKLDYGKEATQQEALRVLKESGQRGIDMMVFSGGGPGGSGVLHAAQLGGYDLDKVTINGQATHSLKGLKLSDGTVITRDIAFAMSAHPSALSRMPDTEASLKLKKSFSQLDPLKEAGWKIEPDLNPDGTPRVNQWHEGQDYKYGRADIRPGYFEFGAPDDRRTSHADASRLDPQTIIAGSRGRGIKFDKVALAAAKEGKPSEMPNPKDLWSVRPRLKPTRYTFDSGPGPEIAKLLMDSLDRELIFQPKTNAAKVSFEKNGIDAYSTKTHEGTGFFGLHRGSFTGSNALILADPHGLDDWITARALTGARGQYLHGLMTDLGLGEKYLVLKTVPVGMDGASDEEWETTRQRTETYREVAIAKALENKKIKYIFTDGPVAQAEMKRILEKLGSKVGRRKLPVIDIQRDGMDPQSGIAEAGVAAAEKVEAFAGKEIKAVMADIPRSHLPWWSRIWEGTGGDHVIDAMGKERGGVRALIAPDWVVKQDVKPSRATAASIKALKMEAESAGVRLGSESVPKFVKRCLETGIKTALK